MTLYKEKRNFTGKGRPALPRRDVRRTLAADVGARRQHHAQRTTLLKLLRDAQPDLSALITDDQAGERWKRSQLVRSVMDPRQAKEASLTRLLGQRTLAQPNQSS